MMDLAGQCRFFDYLADLVDPKYYHADDREHINTKYMKHAERAATKRAFKEQYKQNKRAKLDPDAIKTTTELHKKQAQEAVENGGPADPVSQLKQIAQIGKLHLSAGGQPSREELLQRLHAKMEAARKARNAKEDGEADKQPKSAADSAKQWRKEQLGKKLKAKQQQQQQQQQQGHKQQEQQQEAAAQKRQQQQQPDGAPSGKKAKQAAEQQQKQQDAGLAFNKLQLDTGRPAVSGGKKVKKPSKEVALKLAEEKREKLADAAARQDKELIAAEAWRAALSRASGEKVLDDPKLLRKSLKKEQQEKARKSKRWAERVAAQQEQQKARQDKRKENLAARASTKLENKKAKRDKKLLRAGFEGRKTGFINAPKGKASDH